MHFPHSFGTFLTLRDLYDGHDADGTAQSIYFVKRSNTNDNRDISL